MNEPRPSSELAGEQQSNSDVQAGINATMVSLLPDIMIANTEIEYAFRNQREKYKYLKDHHETYLNEQWHHKGDQFMVAGHWHIPRNIETANFGLFMDIKKEEVLGPAISDGFRVAEIKVGNVSIPRVVHAFATGMLAVQHTSFGGNIELRAFAEPQETSLHFLRPGDDKALPIDSTAIVRAVSNADLLLRAHLRSDRSSFYRLDASEQYRFVHTTLESVDRLLPPGESMESFVLESIRTRVLHYKDAKTNKIHRVVRPAGQGEPFTFTAKMLGVTTFEHMRGGYGGRYESPRQIEDVRKGICLVLEPIDASLDLKEVEGNSVVIPFRAVHKQLLEGRNIKT